jgi:hypothetical protein
MLDLSIVSVTHLYMLSTLRCVPPTPTPPPPRPAEEVVDHGFHPCGHVVRLPCRVHHAQHAIVVAPGGRVHARRPDAQELQHGRDCGQVRAVQLGAGRERVGAGGTACGAGLCVGPCGRRTGPLAGLGGAGEMAAARVAYLAGRSCRPGPSLRGWAARRRCGARRCQAAPAAPRARHRRACWPRRGSSPASQAAWRRRRPPRPAVPPAAAARCTAHARSSERPPISIDPI